MNKINGPQEFLSDESLEDLSTNIENLFDVIYEMEQKIDSVKSDLDRIKAYDSRPLNFED